MLTKEAVLVFSNGEAQGIARHDEKLKTVVFYSLKRMGLDDIERLFNKLEHEKDNSVDR